MLQFQVDQETARRYDVTSELIMSPFVDVLAAEAGDQGAVLDLACGTGYVAEAVARRRGSGAHVVASDVNAAMLAVARQRAGDRYTTVQADASSLPFADGSFDVVLSQQGLQFFPNLDAALSEIARVLRPGGRLIATVWTDRPSNPYLQAQAEAVADVFPDRPVGPAAAFSLTVSAFVAAATAAGLAEAAGSVLIRTVHFPDLRAFARDHFTALPFGAALAAGAPATADLVASGIVERLTDDGAREVSVPFSSTLLTAAKPEA
ncbi:class I SAM-dependent methyltransferase [Curtobacterium sp. 22159]|uniref:class I SAM-dependent methyltransferase n=1 Tax=Curtobacterium sp. 22159 TaxID=3453882 RepID=UPI003F85499B